MKIFRYILYTFLGFFLTGATVLACLPMFLSTTTGHYCIKKTARSLYGKTINFSDVSIGWLSGLTINDLTIDDEKNRPLFHVDKCQVETPLVSILFHPTNIGTVTINAPKAHLYPDTKSTASSTSSNSPPLFIPPKATVIISDGFLEIHPEKAPSGGIKHINVEVKTDFPAESNANISATIFNDTVEAPIKASASFSGNSLQHGSGCTSVECSQISTKALSPLVEQFDPKFSQITQELLGSSCSFEMNGSLQNGTLSCTSNFSSKNIQSTVNFSLDENDFTLEAGDLFSITLTPELYSKLSELEAFSYRIKLLEKTTFTLKNEKTTTFDRKNGKIKTPLAISYGNLNPIKMLMEPNSQFFTANIHILCSHDTHIGSCISSIATSKGGKTIPYCIHNSFQWNYENGILSLPTGITKISHPREEKCALDIPCTTDTAPEIVHAFFIEKGQYDCKTTETSIKKISTSIGDHSVTISGSGNISSKTAEIKSNINAKEKIIGNATLSIDSKQRIKGTATLSDFPISLIDTVSGTNLLPILGETISSTISYSLPGMHKKGNWLDIESNGSFWNASLSCTLDEFSLKIPSKKDCSITATIDQQRLNALKKTFPQFNSISLKEPLTTTVSIKKLSANIGSLLEKNPSAYFTMLDTLSLETEGTVSPFNLMQKDQVFLSLDTPTRFSTYLTGKSREVKFSFTSPQTHGPSIFANGTLTDVWTNDRCNTVGLSANADITIERFPTKTAELFSPGKGDLYEKTFGPHLSAKAHVHITNMTMGNVLIDCSSQNASLHFDSIIDKGILRLKSPATATVKITPEAGTLFLKNISPLLASGAHSNESIQLLIPADGVQIPLNPFSIQSIVIPNINVKMGPLVVNNEGTLKVVLSVLGQNKACLEKTVSIWPTPIYASLAHGILDCKRTDILVADSIHMIYWGTANLNTQNLDMVVAIPSDTLRELRLIPKEFRPSSIQIPITGSMNAPNVDTTRAIAKITGASVSGYAKNPQLQLFGALVEAASSIGEDEKPIPPPTTNPLPWNTRR